MTMPLPSDYAKRHRQERRAALLSRLAADAIAREAQREIEIGRLATPDERQARKEV